MNDLTVNDLTARSPATLAHLPAIYQDAASEPADGALLRALLRAHEVATAGIEAVIDDGSAYLDPLTTPAVPQDPLGEAPSPTAVETLRTILTRARSILALGEFPAATRARLEDVVRRGDAVLAGIADERPGEKERLERSWRLVRELARRADPVLAAAANSPADRAEVAALPAVPVMRAVVWKAWARRESCSVSGSEQGLWETLTAKAVAELDELEATAAAYTAKAWAVVQDLWIVPPLEVGMHRSTAAATARGRSARAIPPDFLTWLGTWVGVDVAEVESVRGDVGRERLRRQFVKEAVARWRHRGTRRALEVTVQGLHDVDIAIEEWAWPHGMRIEESSTIGVDTVFVPEPDLASSFVAVWNLPQELTRFVAKSDWRLPLARGDGQRGQWVRPLIVDEPDDATPADSDAAAGVLALRTKAQKISRALDRERPAHARYYLALALEERRVPDAMVIEAHSTIGACLFR